MTEPALKQKHNFACGVCGGFIPRQPKGTCANCGTEWDNGMSDGSSTVQLKHAFTEALQVALTARRVPGVLTASNMADELWPTISAELDKQRLMYEAALTDIEKAESALALKDAQIATLTQERDEQEKLGIKAEGDAAMWKKSAESKQRHINNIEAELAALRAQPQSAQTWQPMSTHDGSRKPVVIWWPYWNQHDPFVASLRLGRWEAECILSDSAFDKEAGQPIAWQPLPAPPHHEPGQET